MSDTRSGGDYGKPRPFIKANRRPDILGRLAARAASQPPATTPAAIAAQAAHPISAAARRAIEAHGQ
jgi:hypothetical protein